MSNTNLVTCCSKVDRINDCNCTPREVGEAASGYISLSRSHLSTPLTLSGKKTAVTKIH